MADDVRLDTPRVQVTMDDGRQWVVQVRNPDYLAWDRTAAKHRWGSMRDVPLTWLTFVAWAALRRVGHINGDMTWEAFSETHAVEVKTVKADGEPAGDEDAVDPTPPGPGPA